MILVTKKYAWPATLGCMAIFSEVLLMAWIDEAVQWRMRPSFAARRAL